MGSGKLQVFFLAVLPESFNFFLALLPESFNFDDLSLFKCVLTSPGFLCTNSPFSRLHAITLTFVTSLALAG